MRPFNGMRWPGAGAFLLFLLLAPFAVTTAAETEGDADDACAVLLNTKCETCHYKTRICQKLGKKTKRGWRVTIKRMVRHGLKISDEERDVLVDCLTELPEGADTVCK